MVVDVIHADHLERLANVRPCSDAVDSAVDEPMWMAHVARYCDADGSSTVLSLPIEPHDTEANLFGTERLVNAVSSSERKV